MLACFIVGSEQRGYGEKPDEGNDDAGNDGCNGDWSHSAFLRRRRLLRSSCRLLCAVELLALQRFGRLEESAFKIGGVSEAVGWIERYGLRDDLTHVFGNARIGEPPLACCGIGDGFRQAKVQHHAKRVDVRLYGCLAKPVLFGRGELARSKMRRVAYGSLMIFARNAEIDECQPLAG